MCACAQGPGSSDQEEARVGPRQQGGPAPPIPTHRAPGSTPEAETGESGQETSRAGGPRALPAGGSCLTACAPAHSACFTKNSEKSQQVARATQGQSWDHVGCEPTGAGHLLL